MTCGGPNELLLRLVTTHAGCMVEWLLHAGWLKGLTALVIFVLTNTSRNMLISAFIKLHWR